MTGSAPAWDGARWIGEIWRDDVDAALAAGHSSAELVGGEPFRHARILLRDADGPIGFAEARVVDGTIDLAGLRVLADAAGRRDPRAARAGTAPNARAGTAPSISVVLCTRDRVEMLRDAVTSLRALEYPDFEVVVVDNAARTDATRRYVEALGDAGVRVVDEPRPGLSRARNAGLRAAEGRIVAFTDDDVVVDRHWLTELATGFASPSVACVSGWVPAAELRTPAQTYFDRMAGWSRPVRRRTFDVTAPPDDIPLFPFAVGHFGTGANFALDRGAAFELGGFDEALGAGAPTRGGEDLDMFVRILLGGAHLTREPAAIVWHRHRASADLLLQQAKDYDMGMGAWLAKVASRPTLARHAFATSIRRAPALAAHVRGASSSTLPDDDIAALLPDGLGTWDWRAVFAGARAFRAARRDGRRATPLRGVTT